MEQVVHWQRKHPRISLVMVSLDSTGDIEKLRSVLTQLHLQHIPQYVNAEPMPEKLRVAFFSQWQGEIPRTLIIDKKGNRFASSGLLNAKTLNELLKGL